MLSTACAFLLQNRKLLYILLTPTCLAFIPVVYPTPAAQCGYVMLVMVCYWITECISVGITGVLPLIFFPLFGISTSEEVASKYMGDTVFVLLGSMAIAAAMAKTGLHKRLALLAMLILGQSPAILCFGLMSTTAFFSMWMSNVVTTVMMLGIADVIAEEMSKPDDDYDGQMVPFANNDSSTSAERSELMVEKTDEAQVVQTDMLVCNLDGTEAGRKDEHKRQQARRLDLKETRKLIALSISYAASCGGIATLTGSANNLMLIAILKKVFNTNASLNFASWLFMCLPLSILMLLTSWLWLQACFLGLKPALRQMCRNSDSQAVAARVRRRLKQEYKSLGPFSFSEAITTIYFVLLVFAWIMREPGFPGWSSWFRKGFVSDSCAGMIALVLCACTPVSLQRKEREINGRVVKGRKLQFLLTWKDFEKAVPWEVLFLFGGGFAIAEGCKKTGLNALIGESLKFLGYLPTPVLVLTVIAITAMLTEVTTNIAVVSIVVPILADLSVNLRVNPLLSTLPATIACSFAFMLPVATPSNTVIYVKGYVKVSDMVKCGIGLNVFAVLLTFSATYTYMDWYFGLTQFPQWADISNGSTGSNTSSLFPADAAFNVAYFNQTA